MKTLLLIRHAKSSWSDPSLADSERALNHRGKSDAKMMAKRIKEKEIDIDLFVSSPAKRAKKTAKIFMKEFDAKEKDLLLDPFLYEGSVRNFYDAVENLNEKEKVVALFAHNPGITEFINSLECSPIYEMPTCAVYALKIKTKDWKDFHEAEKEFLFFDFPKNEE
ncbi:MAG TPA: histidine phosphatase family protein [Hanamia sp.]|nr:histidine phosphatase family protein [Hanamia sp.]